MKIGIHVTKKINTENGKQKDRGSLNVAIGQDITTFQITAAQIYTYGPQSTKPITIDYKKLQQVCTMNNLCLLVHSTYLTIAIWNISHKNINEIKTKNMLDHFEQQIKTCVNLKAFGLVVHLPRKNISEIVETMQIIAPILIKYSMCIILEISPTNIKEISYAYNVNLNELCKRIVTLKIPNTLWGLCIDTAHLWSAGIDVASKNNMHNWLKLLEYPEQIKLFHLNGSRANKFNTGSDIHEVALSPNDEIFKQFITSYKNPSLEKIRKSAIYEITIFARTYNIPIILEVDRQYEFYIHFLINTIRKLLNIKFPL